MLFGPAYKGIPLSSVVCSSLFFNYNQQIGINAYYSDKTGGQTQYLDSPSNDSLYGIQFNTEHVDVFSKSGVFFEKFKMTSKMLQMCVDDHAKQVEPVVQGRFPRGQKLVRSARGDSRFTFRTLLDALGRNTSSLAST